MLIGIILRHGSILIQLLKVIRNNGHRTGHEEGLLVSFRNIRIELISIYLFLSLVRRDELC